MAKRKRPKPIKWITEHDQEVAKITIPVKKGKVTRKKIVGDLQKFRRSNLLTKGQHVSVSVALNGTFKQHGHIEKATFSIGFQQLFKAQKQVKGMLENVEWEAKREGDPVPGSTPSTSIQIVKSYTLLIKSERGEKLRGKFRAGKREGSPRRQSDESEVLKGVRRDKKGRFKKLRKRRKK